jgi:hypothetical protein
MHGLGMRARRLGVVFLALGACAAGAGDLTVLEGVWTTSVSDRQYGPRVQPASQARPIYFWTRLSGGPESLQELQQQGKLPVRHVWKFSNVFKSGTEKVDPVQEKALPVGDIVDHGGLSAAVGQTGSFTWRTWSRKDAVWGGTWAVTVQYADGQPVMCGGKPCQWTIKLRE